MKAFILAAGLGTRLRPWTLSHPKALVPVAGVPMLERVILNLKKQGFTHIVVNVHHFASQIVDFLNARDFGVEISVSDESGQLMDTGGGILFARDLLCRDSEPFLIHNVDILSNADLQALMEAHRKFAGRGGLSTLLVSDRDSSRRLVFDSEMSLRGWHNLSSGEYRPVGFVADHSFCELAFSGIHVMSPGMLALMSERGLSGPFPIVDFLLDVASCSRGTSPVNVWKSDDLSLIDIGKPETLKKADSLLESSRGSL